MLSRREGHEVHRLRWRERIGVLGSARISPYFAALTQRHMSSRVVCTAANTPAAPDTTRAVCPCYHAGRRTGTPKKLNGEALEFTINALGATRAKLEFFLSKVPSDALREARAEIKSEGGSDA